MFGRWFVRKVRKGWREVIGVDVRWRSVIWIRTVGMEGLIGDGGGVLVVVGGEGRVW